MKKVQLIVILLFMSGAKAANMVPILKGVHDSQQHDVYSTILCNSFPTILLPEYKARLLEVERKQLLTDPNEFLTARIQKVCSDAEITYIPKSLYQLFVYYTMLKELTESTDRTKTFNIWCSDTTEYPNAIGAGDYKMFDDLFLRFQRYNENTDVQNAFWKINGIIHDALVTKKENVALIVDNLVDDTLAFYKQLRGIKLPYSLPPVPLDKYRKMIADLIIAELTAPKGTYRIYRGESQFMIASGETVMLTKEMQPPPRGITERTQIAQGRSYNICYSFSDGLFAGIARDFESGSAFGKAILNDNVICVDLPLTCLFNESCPIFIPPIHLIGAVLGEGEFHHLRTRKIEVSKGVTDFQSMEITKEKLPIFFTDESPVEHFWDMLQLICKKNYFNLRVANYTLPLFL